MNAIIFDFYLSNKKFASMEIPIIHIYSNNSDIKFYIKYASHINAVINSITTKYMHITIKHACYSLHIDDYIDKIKQQNITILDTVYRYFGYEDNIIFVDMLTLCSNFITQHFGDNIYTIDNTRFDNITFQSRSQSDFDISGIRVIFALKDNLIHYIKIGNVMHHIGSKIWSNYVDDDGIVIFKSTLNNTKESN